MGSPFWINPCNVEKQLRPPLEEAEGEKCELPEAVLVNNILNQTNIALTSAYQVKHQFISTIFRREYDKVEEQYKDHRLCWLPTLEDIPKRPGQRLSLSKLKNISFHTVLPTIYTSLQKIAAGMEMVFKTEDYKRFIDMKYHLKNLLCELYTAFKEKKIDMPSDVTRGVVPAFYRNMKNEKQAEVRDYIIFRDYINILEYAEEVFNNIVQKYPTISFFKTNVIVYT